MSEYFQMNGERCYIGYNEQGNKYYVFSNGQYAYDNIDDSKYSHTYDSSYNKYINKYKNQDYYAEYFD